MENFGIFDFIQIFSSFLFRMKLPLIIWNLQVSSKRTIYQLTYDHMSFNISSDKSCQKSKILPLSILIWANSTDIWKIYTLNPPTVHYFGITWLSLDTMDIIYIILLIESQFCSHNLIKIDNFGFSDFSVFL
jgi:hypothetical protein